MATFSRVLIIVDFPEPDLPAIPNLHPFSIFKLIPSRINGRSSLYLTYVSIKDMVPLIYNWILFYLLFYYGSILVNSYILSKEITLV